MGKNADAITGGRRRLHRRALAAAAWAAVLLWALGCSSPPAAGPVPKQAVDTSRPAKLEEPPAAVLPDGTRITLELAVTPEEKEEGLMFRPTLPRDRGMLFLFSQAGYPGFWMKNTLIPLDIIFLDDEGRIVSIAAEVPPCAADPCPQYRPDAASSAVLELAAGVAGAHHLAPGTRLRFSRVPGYPAR